MSVKTRPVTLKQAPFKQWMQGVTDHNRVYNGFGSEKHRIKAGLKRTKK
jgi:hypothetical protein